jgi:hypothetical protein
MVKKLQASPEGRAWLNKWSAWVGNVEWIQDAIAANWQPVWKDSLSEWAEDYWRGGWDGYLGDRYGHGQKGLHEGSYLFGSYLLYHLGCPENMAMNNVYNSWFMAGSLAGVSGRCQEELNDVLVKESGRKRMKVPWGNYYVTVDSTWEVEDFKDFNFASGDRLVTLPTKNGFRRLSWSPGNSGPTREWFWNQRRDMHRELLDVAWDYPIWTSHSGETFESEAAWKRWRTTQVHSYHLGHPYQGHPDWPMVEPQIEVPPPVPPVPPPDQPPDPPVPPPVPPVPPADPGEDVAVVVLAGISANLLLLSEQLENDHEELIQHLVAIGGKIIRTLEELK